MLQREFPNPVSHKKKIPQVLGFYRSEKVFQATENVRGTLLPGPLVFYLSEKDFQAKEKVRGTHGVPL